MEEWEIDAEYLTIREKLKSKVGNKENLQNFVKNYSLTTLAQNFGVGRNTLKRLCDDWDIEL